jgi:molybdopterin converting factor small subunit
MSDAASSDAGTVTVRYWAAARAAAGRSEDAVPAGPLDAVLAAALALHPGNDRLAQVVPICSVLVGDVAVRAADRSGIDVPHGSLVELLPPFAGG